MVASCAPPLGTWPRNTGMCPDWESDQLPVASQSGAQSNEPHQPGHLYLFLERGEGGNKRGRKTLICERNISWLPFARPQWGTWPASQACALIRSQTSDLSVRRPTLGALNQGWEANFVTGFGFSRATWTLL